MRLFKRNWLAIIFFIFWAVYFTAFWFRAITVKNGDIITGHNGIWADWAVHFTYGSAFAYRTMHPLYHPLFLDVPFTYPFMADLLSGLLIRLGIPFFSAFLWPSFLFSLALIGALFLVYKKMAHSVNLAILAATIFMFGGGLGFIYKAPEYTSDQDHNIQLINIIPSQIIPQRAFTFGFPIALALLCTVLQLRFREHTKNNYLYAVILGIIMGVMPIIHTHSFLALLIILGYFAILDFKKSKTWWLIFFGVAGTLALYFYFKFLHVEAQSFIKWQPSWLANGKENVIWFWLKNWGVVLPLALFGFAVAQKKQKLLTLPFLLLFVLGNLFLFQPSAWDNTKIFTWASLGISLLAALAIAWLWQKHWLIKTATVILLFLAIFSGATDAFRVQSVTAHQTVMYTAEEMSAAKWVRENTPKEAISLTGDQHNHFVPSLSGQQIVMGYRGYLWSYSINYAQVEQDEYTMFRGERLYELIPKYDINYIVIGPDEINNFQANKDLLEERFETVYKSTNYTILKTGI